MFRRLFKRAKPARRSIRDTLFGDMPMDAWGSPTPDDVFPWNSFAAAREHLARSNEAGAIKEWERVLAARGLEPRHYLQAWHFMREHGRQPPSEIGKKVLGIVVEVGMREGLDLLAAYDDHAARYYNFSGAGVVWEHPDDSLNAIIDHLLCESSQAVAELAPWEGSRPAAPPAGVMRLSFLTPSGIHFGQGPMNTLATDPRGAQVVLLATELMQALIAKTQVNR